MLQRTKPQVSLTEDKNGWGRTAPAGHITTTNISIDKGTKIVSLSDVNFIPYPEYKANRPNIIFDSLLEDFASSGKFTLNGLLLSTGSNMLLELQNGTAYMVAVYRDRYAPTYSNIIDSLAGLADTERPLDSSIKESVEEVIMLKGSKVLIPQYTERLWTAYNSAIRSTITDMARGFGIESFVETEVSTADFQNPLYYLDGERKLVIDVGLNAFKGQPISIAATVVTPPINIRTDSLEGLSFRETLEIETNGRVPERAVVLLRIRGSGSEPGLIVYSKGTMVSQYGTVAQFMAERGISDRPYTPFQATLLKAIGFEDRYLIDSYYPNVSELLRSS